MNKSISKINWRNIRMLILFSIIPGIIFYSCKGPDKKSTILNVNEIIGYWNGTMFIEGIDSEEKEIVDSVFENKVQIHFMKDAIVKMTAMGVENIGTYELKGNSIMITTPDFKQEFVKESDYIHLQLGEDQFKFYKTDKPILSNNPFFKKDNIYKKWKLVSLESKEKSNSFLGGVVNNLAIGSTISFYGNNYEKTSTSGKSVKGKFTIKDNSIFMDQLNGFKQRFEIILLNEFNLQAKDLETNEIYKYRPIQK